MTVVTVLVKSTEVMLGVEEHRLRRSGLDGSRDGWHHSVMTTRDTAFAPGTPCWVDVLCSDPDRVKAFYAGLFGWTVEESGPEFGNYANFRSDGQLVAGLVPNSGEQGSPDAWTTYIATTDAQATTAAVTDGGGQILAAPMQVGELGSMAVLADPAGGVFGIWQPGTHTGFTKYNEPGGVTWDEHHSKDFAVTTPFYASIFGWQLNQMSDTDDFRYSTGQIDGEDVVGLMDSASFLPAEVPSHWAVYFSVDDVDAALVRLTGLGGSVLRPAEDTPFGRMADAADPTGASFKLAGQMPSSGS